MYSAHGDNYAPEMRDRVAEKAGGFPVAPQNHSELGVAQMQLRGDGTVGELVP